MFIWFYFNVQEGEQHIELIALNRKINIFMKQPITNRFSATQRHSLPNEDSTVVT